MNCDGCGKSLEATELIVECANCDSIFCEECVDDGIYSTHQCEDYRKDEQWDPITWKDDDVALFEEGYWCD